ncbi:MAG TPA: VOC family protein [Actinomycetota bacterium]|nr:VOC family protein [Actinomycetota bacterium]
MIDELTRDPGAAQSRATAGEDHVRLARSWDTTDDDRHLMVRPKGGIKMASRFTELIVDANDPGALARFWGEALGWRMGESDGFPFLIPPDPAIPLILFLPVPEDKSVKNRLHIDVSPTDGTRDEEVERLLAIGATRADIGQGDVDWVVLRDPEGNEFCVLGTQVDADLTKWPWPGMDG